MFRSQLREGQIVYDIGAHMGYYTVIGSSAVGPNGRVIAFEPLPFNLSQLRRHIHLNRCGNVTVIDKCVAERSGRARFSPGTGTGTGRLTPDGALEVEVVSLDDAVSSGALPPPDVMKIDVEGAELSVLKGAEKVIARSRPTILLSLHSEELQKECSNLLAAWGYHVESVKTTGAFDSEILAMPQACPHHAAYRAAPAS